MSSMEVSAKPCAPKSARPASISEARVDAPWAIFLLTCVPWVCTIPNVGMLLRKRPWSQLRGEKTMPKFVIERELPGAGKLSAAELQAISQKSNQVIAGLGPEIVWQQSYVTDDKIYCVYVAPDSDIIFE